MPLTGILVLAVVLAALGPLQCEAATEYYVRPVSDTSCPGEPCLTWTEYVSHTDQYVHSNTTFWFMPGTHHMNMPLKASNVSNVALIGFRDKPQVLGNISCKCVRTPCGCAGFMFSNATHITLEMLNLSIQLHNNSNETETGGLSFFNISSLHVINCNVSVTAVYNKTLRFIPCAMFISSSTHVELMYVNASNTNGKGICFLNTNYGSITDFIVYSSEYGIFLFECFAISIRCSLFKGGKGIMMKNTINSSVTDTVFINTSQTALYLFQATNITVSNTTITSSHNYGIYIKQVTNTLFHSVCIHWSVEYGMHIEKSKNVSIVDFTLHSGKSGLSMRNSHAINISHLRVKGEIGIYMKNTINSSVANTYILNSSRTAIYLFRAINITVSNTTIASSQTNGIYINEVTNAILCNISVHWSTKDGIYVILSNNIIIVDFSVYSHEYGITLVHSSAITIAHAKITGRMGIGMQNTTNCNVMNTAVMPTNKITRDKFAIQVNQATNITISNTNITSPHCSGVYRTKTSNISSPLISSLHSNETKTVVHCYRRTIGIHLIDVNRILISNSKVEYFVNTGIYVSKTVNLNIMNSVIQNAIKGVVMRIEWSKNVLVHNVTTANWYTAIRVNRCQNIALSLIQFIGYGSYDRWQIYFTSSINITIKDCHFTNFTSPWPTTEVITQPAVIEMNNNSGVTFHSNTFEGNSISCLKLVNTHFTVNGTLTFEGNSVYRGAALIFIDKSSLTISDESTLVFKNNNAATTGGAIYVVSSNYYVPTEHGLQSRSPCFLKVEDKSKMARLIFKNNTANQGGDVLYGGSLGRACTGNSSNKYRCNSCLQVFRNVSKISPKTLSSITSDPSRVCYCINGSSKPNCFVLFHFKFSLYSGQSITISAVVVGQDFGTVAGSVYAHFLPEMEKDSSVALGEKEESQGVRQHSCNNLTYTILSHSQTIKEVVLILTAVNKHETQLILPETMDIAKENYEKYKEGNVFPQNLLDFPIYINITILVCPPGFSSTPKKCHCHCNEQLQQLTGVLCDIQTQTISRTGQVWVGSVTDINNTVTHVITSSQCPLQYCKREDVRVSLSQPDSQCSYNRSGILCGGCQPGLSLVLGSSQCLECSNTYLALVIPFALAGIVLVFSIKFLDLTIAQGFINGFIFYANILKANENLLVPRGPINPLTLFISWLNLDLGIETCFFDGLNTFTKTLLQLVFPLYVLFTVWVIIMSSRYSRKVAKVFGRNSVPVLATLFLLSYAKLIQLIITALSYTFVEFPHGKRKTVWSADGNIDYLENPHLVLFLAAIAILVFLWVPYTLLNLSAQWLQKYNVYIITTILNRIKPFLDAHYGPLKDKHRYWFGVLLLTRVAILLMSQLIPSHNFGIVILSIVTASFLLTGCSITGQYRNFLVSVYELSLFINLGLLATVQYQTHITQTNKSILAYSLIGVAFLQFIALILYRAYRSLNPWVKIHFGKYHTQGTSSNDGENDDGNWRYNNTLELMEVSAQHRLISNSENSQDRDATPYVEYTEGEYT